MTEKTKVHVMAVMPEGEARFRVVELVKSHPQIGVLLLKLQVDGISNWVTLLEKLQQAIAENQGH